jgi:hypothetical protein
MSEYCKNCTALMDEVERLEEETADQRDLITASTDELFRCNKKISCCVTSERQATAAMIYLAEKLATDSKPSTTWIQEALAAADKIPRSHPGRRG